MTSVHCMTFIIANIKSDFSQVTTFHFRALHRAQVTRNLHRMGIYMYLQHNGDILARFPDNSPLVWFIILILLLQNLVCVLRNLLQCVVRTV